MITESESGSRHHPYRASHTRPVPESSPIRPPLSRSSRLAALLASLFVLICAWLVLIALRERSATQAVRALPESVQAATYRRAYEELATACATEPGLADHCTDEAQFILRFPQCTADCQQLARRYFPVVRK